MKYAFINLVFLFLCLAAPAQIVYVDVVPDTTVQSFFYPYDIDLDSNGVIDFTLKSYCMSPDQAHNVDCYDAMYIQGTASNAIAENSPGYPLVMFWGDTIGVASIPYWLDSATSSYAMLASSTFNTTSSNYNTSGTWIGAMDKYLGVRFMISGQTHYGWIRMTVQNSGQYLRTTVKDWAYNTIADSAILAGDGWVTGIPATSNEPGFSAYASENSIIVHLPAAAEATVSVYNSCGQLLIRNEHAQGDEPVKAAVNAGGIYLVVVEYAGRMSSVKVPVY